MKKRRSVTTRNSGAKRTASKPAAQRQSDAHPFEMRLRAIVNAFDVVNTLTAPLVLSIKNLLSVAADSFNCDEASVIVRDDNDDNDGSLKFLCAIGEVADGLMRVKIPQGKGIAGFVFETGQPLAVADVSRESAFYADIDKATGYSTQTLLASPLLVDGRTVGVLEFVNRLEGPPFQPFTSSEMDRAAHFAAAIAPLVAAHERAGLIETLFSRAMSQALAGEPEPASPEPANHDGDLRRWLDDVRAAPEHRDLLMLAVLLRDVASCGDAEREMCRGVLETLAAFVKQGAGADDDRTFLS